MSVSVTLALSDSQTRKKYLWWGRYVTQFQIAQFVANLLQAYYCMYNSPYPRFMSELLLWYMVSLLVLFGAQFAPRSVRSLLPHTTLMRIATWSLRCAGSFYYSKHVAPKKGGAARKKVQ